MTWGQGGRHNRLLTGDNSVLGLVAAGGPPDEIS